MRNPSIIHRPICVIHRSGLGLALSESSDNRQVKGRNRQIIVNRSVVIVKMTTAPNRPIIDRRIVGIVRHPMDLVFKEKDGWAIADYKTDKVDRNLQALITYLKPQVEMYRKFWEKISGEKVKEAGLYFTDSKQWVALRS